MSKLYRWNIHGKNFKYIDPTEAKKIWNSVKKCSQSIRYDADNKRVILISKNIADITNAIERELWEHTRKPTQVGPGWKAYIIPCKKEMDKHPKLAHGAEFDIVGKPTTTASNLAEWQSEV